MLKLIIPGGTHWDKVNEKFLEFDQVELKLEHSLLSVSKWEAFYQKPFLAPGEKTREEVLGYLKAMVMTPDADLDAVLRCDQKSIDEIQAYIASPQTATTFAEMPQHRGPSEIITSELIYYWMASAGIPFETERWHLNRLLTLIRVASIKSSKPKKISKHEIAQRNRQLNEQRKQQYGTKG